MKPEQTHRHPTHLHAALRVALAEQQFVLYYQPVFDQQRNMTGAEALVRWMHPQRGLVGPCAFIPQAEKSHLIVEIGDWVLQAACRQLVQWQSDAAACRYTIAVNVSARQVRQPGFVAGIIALLAETGANPRLLKLELTESMLVGNVDAIVDKMNALKAYGIGMALDDFGTGYSSLCYLDRLPVTHIKIDRSFVRNMFVTPRAATIVQALIALARALDLEVVAEGVETEEQWAALIGFGARRFQGFLFAAPVPVGALRNWMA
jgi:EAL domain-containing protein (putative c-di-GMP-specific phosphodiesterase class I)